MDADAEGKLESHLQAISSEPLVIDLGVSPGKMRVSLGRREVVSWRAVPGRPAGSRATCVPPHHPQQEALK